MKYYVLLLFICACHILGIDSFESLSDKTQQLIEWSRQRPVISLNSERFKQYVRLQPKNYSMFVMFTALSPQRQCGICKQAYDEFQTVAQSYRYYNPTATDVFFAMIDFDDGSDIFQQLKLNSAPVFIHFPAKMKPKKSDYMDANRWGFSAEQMAKWVHDRAQVSVQIYRPPNYSALGLIAFTAILAVTLLYVKRDSLGFLFSPVVWGLFVIFAILICISGQIWNTIRRPPFVHRNQKSGEYGLFSGTSGYQFIAETYAVFLLYFGVSLGMIILNAAPKIKSKTGRSNTLVAFIGLLMVMGFFSYIVSVFRAKYQGYPYSFLLK